MAPSHSTVSPYASQSAFSHTNAESITFDGAAGNAVTPQNGQIGARPTSACVPRDIAPQDAIAILLRVDHVVERFEFVAQLWLYDGDAAWHFITVPQDVSDQIDAASAGRRGGFGAVRVRVTVGDTTWLTSLFPDSKRGAYLLPVKKEVRHREDLAAGADVTVALDLVED